MWTPRPPRATTGSMSERTELPTITKRSTAMSWRSSSREVSGLVLLSHDLHCVEVVGQPGGGDFGLLVPQVALGDKHQPITVLQLLDGVGHPVEQLHRVGVHLLGPAHDGVNLLGGDLALGGLDGRLDHRQHEPLDAVAGKWPRCGARAR